MGLLFVGNHKQTCTIYFSNQIVYIKYMKVLRIQLIDGEHTLLDTQLPTQLTVPEVLQFMATLTKHQATPPQAPTPGKYSSISQHLQTAQSPLTLTFEQVEVILGFPLPQSARKHRAWWSNTTTGHSQASAWLSQGWTVSSVDADQVTFQKAEV